MSKQNTKKPAGKRTTPVSGTSPGTGGPFGAANNARSINPTAFSHQLVPNLGTLWAENRGVCARCWYLKATSRRPHRQRFVDRSAQAASAPARGADSAERAKRGRQVATWLVLAMVVVGAGILVAGLGNHSALMAADGGVATRRSPAANLRRGFVLSSADITPPDRAGA